MIIQSKSLIKPRQMNVEILSILGKIMRLHLIVFVIFFDIKSNNRFQLNVTAVEIILKRPSYIFPQID